jgi:hypothetical protein
LSEEQEGDLGDILSGEKWLDVRFDILPDFRRFRPLIPSQHRVQQIRHCMIHDGFKRSLRRLELFRVRKRNMDVPSDGIP